MNHICIEGMFFLHVMYIREGFVFLFMSTNEVYYCSYIWKKKRKETIMRRLCSLIFDQLNGDLVNHNHTVFTITSTKCFSSP